MGGFQHEIEATVEAGVPPLEALTSATGDSARSCGVDDRVGAIAPGKLADLLVVEGDPSRDINALWNVVDVFQDGLKVDRRGFV